MRWPVTLVAVPLGGWWRPQFVEKLLEPLAVLGPVDGRAEVPRMLTPALPSGSQVQRRLAAELDDHARRLFRSHDVQHVFQGQRLEVELVGGVVVGGDGLGVGVDHDGLEAHPAGRTRHGAAVVELDALADAVGSAAQDHDLVSFRSSGPRPPFVGGIVVRGVGLELGGAGVHQLIDRLDAVLPVPKAIRTPADLQPLVQALEDSTLEGWTVQRKDKQNGELRATMQLTEPTGLNLAGLPPVEAPSAIEEEIEEEEEEEEIEPPPPPVKKKSKK